MSTEEKPKEEKKEAKLDIVETNVAILQSKLSDAEKQVDELTRKLSEITAKYEQAKDFIETDSKKRLIADLKSKTTVPVESLVKLTVDELEKMKKTLDSAMVPAFKSGTPVVEDSPQKGLDNMYSDYMRKLRGKN